MNPNVLRRPPAERYPNGSWEARQWKSYFRNLPPKSLHKTQVSRFDRDYHLSDSNDPDLKVEFLVIAISAGCHQYYKLVEEILKGTQKMEHLLLLYRALVEGPGKEEQIMFAKRVFSQSRSSYNNTLAEDAVHRLLSSYRINRREDSPAHLRTPVLFPYFIMDVTYDIRGRSYMSVMKQIKSIIIAVRPKLWGKKVMPLPLDNHEGSTMRLYLRLRLINPKSASTCVLIFRLNDFYLIGFESPWRLYEIKRSHNDDPHISSDFGILGNMETRYPEVTSFNTDYFSMVHYSTLSSRHGISIDSIALETAVEALASENYVEEKVATAVLSCVVMFCESLKFKSLRRRVTQALMPLVIPPLEPVQPLQSFLVTPEMNVQMSSRRVKVHYSDSKWFVNWSNISEAFVKRRGLDSQILRQLYEGAKPVSTFSEAIGNVKFLTAKCISLAAGHGRDNRAGRKWFSDRQYHIRQYRSSSHRWY